MADLSKVKIGDNSYNLKDASARGNISTMLGDHAVAALGAAAWEGVAANISGSGLVSASVAKSYVDSQVGAINKFDVVVCEGAAASVPAGAGYSDKNASPAINITGTLAGSASTMYKLYLVKNDNASAGTYIEYITVRSGAGTDASPYTYSWEKIGSTQADLSGYVPSSTKVAGVDLADDITVAELQAALGIEELAYAETASGSFTPAGTISEVDATPAGTVTLNDFTQTATNATLTKGNFTPSGSITGSAISDGTISVSVKDAASATEATLTRGDYTPAGSVAITADNNGSFQVAGTNAASEVSFTGGSTKNVLASIKTAAVAPTFTEGTFTAASLGDGFYTAGTAASYSHSGFSGGSLGEATTSDFNTDGMKVAMGTGDDAETLIFSAASTSKAVTAQGAFTAAVYGTDSFTANTPAVIDVSKFSGGSKAADTFTAGSAAEFNTADVVDNIGTGSAAAQVFTGNKYAPSFSGTKEENLKVTKAEYLKQEIDQATFSGTAATLGFSGTEAQNVIVTAVSYDKATANGASFAGTANKITPTFTGTAGTVSVTPDSAT